MAAMSSDARAHHHYLLIILVVILALVVWAEECFPQLDHLIETPYAPSGYAQLLKDYVVQIGNAGVVETRFDYARFYASAGQRELREDLRNKFLSANPATMDPATRHAWAVNAYNFLVIDRVMEYFVAPGKDTLQSIQDLGPKPFAVFDDLRYKVDAATYSLNSFEKHFVFDKDMEDSGPPDPRYHFVLVCAAKGCPPLMAWPIAPEDLDDMLDRAVRNALRLPSQLRLDGKTLHVSKIFDWYVSDFQERNRQAFLSRYAPDDVRLALSEKKLDVKPDIEWDWGLNRP